MEGFAVERLVGGDEGQARVAREADQGLEHPLLRPIEVALDLHEAIAGAEDSRESVQVRARGPMAARGHQAGERAVGAAGEADEARP